MGLLDRLRNLFGGGGGGVAPPTPDARSGSTTSQTPRTTSSDILNYYNTNLELRRAVSVVSSRFGAMRWMWSQNGVPLDPSHPMVRAWMRPNGDMTGRAMRTVQHTWMALLGEHFIRVWWDGDRPVLQPIPASWVNVRYSGMTTTFEVRYPGAGQTVTYGTDEMVWMKSINAEDPYGRASGKGFAATDEVEISEYSAAHSKSFFYNGATPGGIVSIKDAQPGDVDRIKAKWNSRNQGPQRAHGVHVIGNTALQYTQTSTDYKDLGIVELRASAANMIRELFGVPPELIGQIENSNRATIQAALLILAEMVLEPAAEIYREQIEQQLMPVIIEMAPARQRAQFEGLTLAFADPRPERIDRRDAAMESRPWAFTVNEHRVAAGVQPRDDGDVYRRDDRFIYSDAGGFVRLDDADLIKSTPPPLPENVIDIISILKASPFAIREDDFSVEIDTKATDKDAS